MIVVFLIPPLSHIIRISIDDLRRLIIRFYIFALQVLDTVVCSLESPAVLSNSVLTRASLGDSRVRDLVRLGSGNLRLALL